MTDNFNKIFSLNKINYNKIILFLYAFLAIIWPRKLFFSFISLHVISISILIIYLYNNRKYNIILYTVLSLAPYFLNLDNLLETLNPVVYVIIFICSNKILDEKNDLSIFLLSSTFLGILFIIEYISVFPFYFSYDQIYNNKLNLGTDISLQSKIFGNIHNILPFIVTVFSISIMFLLKKIHKLLSIISMIIFCVFTYLYLSRFCIYFITFLILLIILKKLFSLTSSKKFIIYSSLTIVGFLLISMNFSYQNYLLLPLKQIKNEMNILIAKNHKNEKTENLFQENNLKNDISVSLRIQAFMSGIYILNKNFLFGVGPGQYYKHDLIHTSPHNLILKLLIENGIFGLLFLIFLLLKIVNSSNKSLYWLPISVFIIYSTIVGGDLILERLCINYALLTLLFCKVCSSNSIRIDELENNRKM